MTDNEAWRYQISYKIGGAMVNIRAEEEREWIAAIQSFDGMAENIVESVRKVDALFLPSGNTGGPSAPAVAPSYQSAPQGGTGGGEAPVCRHGAMTFRQGQGAKGPWKGFFCPTPKGTPDQCPPQFQR